MITGCDASGASVHALTNAAEAKQMGLCRHFVDMSSSKKNPDLQAT